MEVTVSAKTVEEAVKQRHEQRNDDEYNDNGRARQNEECDPSCLFQIFCFDHTNTP